MSKIKIDNIGFVTPPTLILQNRRFENIDKINNICNLAYKENLNSANELNFTIHKSINDTILPIWDKVISNKVIYSPELNERFIIETSISEDKSVFKQISAKSLCESELSQINLYNIEINTETDINRDDYKNPSTFYNPNNPKTSILNRILEKAPHYHIEYVAETLVNSKKVPEFSFSDKDIYSVLTDDIAKEFNCIFIFNSINRGISVYDLYNSCNVCGYRGDFTDKCPECGSNDFGGQYGKDTTIFISSENLANEITLEPDLESFKNCMYIEGGDDNIDAAIRSINPNGSNYIYYFNKDIKEDMSDELIDILDSYNELYDKYNSTYEYHIDIVPAQKYNLQVQYVIDLFGTDSDFGKNISKLPNNYTLIGYSSTTDAMYNAINLYYILKTSMMPTIDTDGESLKDSINSIINGFNNGFVSKENDVPFINQIAINNSILASQSDVERAIEKTSKIFYGTAYYELEVLTSSYTQATTSTIGTWIGKIKLTSLTEVDENDEKIFLISNEITLSIIENNELYTQQEVYRAISNKDKLSEKKLSSLKMSVSDFQNQLHYYSLDELLNISDIFQSCLDVLIVTDEASDMDDELLKIYEDFYKERLTYIAQEKAQREKQIECVKAIYYSGDNKNGYTSTGILQDLRKKVNSELDIEKYIKLFDNGEIIWNEFCSYRREDKYSNSNYISDGKTDSEIIELAKKLLDVAKKELFKAGTLQYSISTTMNNLLVMKEFSSFTDNFDVGNWIRVRVNDNIYQLRLLSYETNFEDIGKISVEFSTVEKIYTGYSDIESVLNTASSIASSYSGLIQQVDTTSSTANKIDNLVNNGLNATRTKFVDSDEEEILIDNHGILARHYNYITNTYDQYQCKILANGLYTTSNNWETIDTGIGKFSYFDPETNKYVDDYGIIAKNVVGKLFIGEKLKIYGKDTSIILDENGIYVGDGYIDIASGNKRVIIDPKNLGNTGYIFQVHNNDEITVGIKIDGTTNIKAHLTALSLNLNGNKLLSSDIKDLDNTIKNYGYTTNSSVYQYLLNGNYFLVSGTKLSEITGYTEFADSLVLKSTINSDVTFEEITTPSGVKKERIKYTTTIPNADGSSKTFHTYDDDSYVLTNIGIGNGSPDPSSSSSTDTYVMIDKNGCLTADNAVIRGNIYAINGYFSGELKAASGTFSGDIKLNYLDMYDTYDFIVNKDDGINFGYHNGYECYNFIINREGLKLGVGDGGTRYALVIDNIGNITSLGSLKLSGMLNVGNKLTYTNNEGLILNEVTMKNSKIQFSTADTIAGELYCNDVFNVTLFSRSITIESTGGEILLHPSTFTRVNGTLKIGETINSSANISSNSFSLYNNSKTININCDTNGDCIITNSSSMSVGLINNSFSTLAELDGNITLGRSEAKWDTLFIKTPTISTSDRNLKKNISPIGEKYELFFMQLIPVSYLFKDGTSGRTHIGFISQDVENAMTKCGLSDLEFAGFCKDKKQESYIDENGIEQRRNVLDENGNPVYIYSLRYEEFIALNTYILQKCINKIDKLENRIKNIEREMT